MKKLIYLLLMTLMLLISACDNNQGFMGWTNEVNSDGLKRDYKTITIEGCDYIMYDAGEGYAGNGFLAHKGNCRNSIHKCSTNEQY